MPPPYYPKLPHLDCPPNRPSRPPPPHRPSLNPPLQCPPPTKGPSAHFYWGGGSRVQKRGDAPPVGVAMLNKVSLPKVPPTPLVSTPPPPFLRAALYSHAGNARCVYLIKDVERLGRPQHFLDAVLYADNAPRRINAAGSRSDSAFRFSHHFALFFALFFIPAPFRRYVPVSGCNPVALGGWLC